MPSLETLSLDYSLLFDLPLEDSLAVYGGLVSYDEESGMLSGDEYFIELIIKHVGHGCPITPDELRYAASKDEENIFF